MEPSDADTTSLSNSLLSAEEASRKPPRLSFRTTALPQGTFVLPGQGSRDTAAGAVETTQPTQAARTVRQRQTTRIQTESGPDAPLTLIDLLASQGEASSWVRQGRGLVGLGRVIELSAQGEDRIEELRKAWRSVVYASWWSDPVLRPGTGPVALGTITFSARSQDTCVLLVPRVLIGLDEQGAWMTTAVADGEEHPDPDLLLAELVSTARSARAAGHQPASATLAASIETGALNEEQWCQAVAQTQHRMSQGEARKVVLARDILVRPRTPLPVGTVLARLARAYPSCWTFSVDGMIGATPELLVRLEGRRLFSRVLAGTARRPLTPAAPVPSADAVTGAPGTQDEPAPGTPGTAADHAPSGALAPSGETSPPQDVLSELADWLATSEKNREEHALARASATRALTPLCSAIEASAPFVLTLPNVLHLATDVSGVVAGDTGALSLVRALHPTAAVCGTPTPAASRIIEEVEGMDRGRYAGPVGWVDWHGEGEWGIALRSARLHGAQVGPYSPARVFGGGGIMPGSDPQDELAETRAKMRPVLEALGASAD